jgi:hypothetical protein
LRRGGAGRHLRRALRWKKDRTAPKKLKISIVQKFVNTALKVVENVENTLYKIRKMQIAVVNLLTRT